MKYIYLFVLIITGALLLILFFQNIGQSYQLRFLNGYINSTMFMLYLIIISILFGVFLTLFIKSILSNDNTLDEGFDL